jgi:hypothetical protein
MVEREHRRRDSICAHGASFPQKRSNTALCSIACAMVSSVSWRDGLNRSSASHGTLEGSGSLAPLIPEMSVGMLAQLPRISVKLSANASANFLRFEDGFIVFSHPLAKEFALDVGMQLLALDPADD